MITQSKNHVVEAHGDFKKLMAIALNPKNNYQDGVIRCVVSRNASLQQMAVGIYDDKSELWKIRRNANGFEMTERLVIKEQEAVIASLAGDAWNFIGLEDPDIDVDDDGQLHLYFSIAFMDQSKSNFLVHLGHAQGVDLDSLVMTSPAIKVSPDDLAMMMAKEVSVAPINKDGLRLCLFECGDKSDGKTHSVIRLAKVKSFAEPWVPGNVLFYPRQQKISWIGAHASPGPLIPKSFIDVGEGKLVGFMNGKAENPSSTEYGEFMVGLFIYDYEQGKIDWVSPDYVIKDTEAELITFASQLVIEGEKATLYAHVDDAFVRAYSFIADDLIPYLPKI